MVPGWGGRVPQGPEVAMARKGKEEGETPCGCGPGLAGSIGQHRAVTPCGQLASPSAGTLALLDHRLKSTLAPRVCRQPRPAPQPTAPQQPS